MKYSTNSPMYYPDIYSGKPEYLGLFKQLSKELNK